MLRTSVSNAKNLVKLKNSVSCSIKFVTVSIQGEYRSGAGVEKCSHNIMSIFTMQWLESAV